MVHLLGLGNIQCFPRCPLPSNSNHRVGVTCGSHIKVKFSILNSNGDGVDLNNIIAFARFRTREIKSYSKYTNKMPMENIELELSNGCNEPFKKKARINEVQQYISIASSELENGILSKIGNECFQSYIETFINSSKPNGRLGEIYQGESTIISKKDIIFHFSPHPRSTWQLSKYKGSKYCTSLHTLHIIFFEKIKEPSSLNKKMKFIYEIESKEFLILGHRKKVLWKFDENHDFQENEKNTIETRRKMLLDCRNKKVFPYSLINQFCCCKIKVSENFEDHSDSSILSSIVSKNQNFQKSKFTNALQNINNKHEDDDDADDIKHFLISQENEKDNDSLIDFIESNQSQLTMINSIKTE